MKKLEIFYASFLIAFMTQRAEAIAVDPTNLIQTQLSSFGPLQSDVFLPLTNAASGNTAIAGVDGYGWVNSNIAISLSQHFQSTGSAYLGKLDQNGQIVPGEVINGETLSMRRTFNIYFDLTIMKPLHRPGK